MAFGRGDPYVDERAWKSVGTAAPAVAVLLAVWTVLFIVAPTWQPGWIYAVAMGGACAVVLALYAVVRSTRRGLRALEIVSMLSIVAVTLVFLVGTRDPGQTVILMMALMGAGYCVLSIWVNALVGAVSVAAWLGLAWWFAIPIDAHWTVRLCLAVAATMVITVARVRSVAAEGETVAALRESEERNRLVVSSALDAIVTFDCEGRVVDWNASAEWLFGWRADDVRGRDVRDLIVPPMWRDAYDEALAAFRREGGGFPLHQRHETDLMRRDGATLPVEVAIVPIQRGDEVLLSSWVRDLSDQRRAEQAVRAAARAKSDFLATISHEIRTPIHGIIGMTDIALESDDAVERADVLHRTRACAETLLALVNDVLDFSKITAGKLRLECRPLSPGKLIEDVLDTVVVAAEAKQLALVGSVDPRLPAWLDGDGTRLRQVLLNLLSNAVKFTDAGEVEVRLDLVGLDTDAVLVQGTVRDTGTGIPSDKLGEIFEAFTQVEDPTTTRHGGTGLGLAITQRLVDLMRGRLTVDSQVGVGTIFTFTVRLGRSASAPETGPPPPALERLRVLLVDGQIMRRTRVAELLHTWGLEVCEVADVAAAAAACLAEPPCDVAVIDAELPGADAIACVLPTIAVVPMRWQRGRDLGGVAVHAMIARPVKGAGLRAALATVPRVARYAAAG